MFADVYYLDDKITAIVPTDYIKNFHPKNSNDYNSGTVYKVFWNNALMLKQKHDDELEAMKGSKPPNKPDWNKKVGEGNYGAYITRMAESVTELKQSLLEKRRIIPHSTTTTTGLLDESTATEDEDHHVQDKIRNKVVERTKKLETRKLQETSRKRQNEEILKKAKRHRTTIFDSYKEGSPESIAAISDDSDGDETVIPEKLLKDVTEKLEFVEKERDDLYQQVEKLEEKVKTMKEENEEVKELRKLNRDLQKQLLLLCEKRSKHQEEEPEDGIHLNANQNIIDDDEEKVVLGPGICIKKDVWNILKMQNEPTLFVKEFAVAVWGSEELAERSVMGVVSNNRNGRRKPCAEAVPAEVRERSKSPPRPPLTPQKLKTIEAQFTTYLKKRDADPNLVKKVNKYIGDKIQSIRRIKKRQEEEEKKKDMDKVLPEQQEVEQEIM